MSKMNAKTRNIIFGIVIPVGIIIIILCSFNAAIFGSTVGIPGWFVSRQDVGKTATDLGLRSYQKNPVVILHDGQPVFNMSAPAEIWYYRSDFSNGSYAEAYENDNVTLNKITVRTIFDLTEPGLNESVWNFGVEFRLYFWSGAVLLIGMNLVYENLTLDINYKRSGGSSYVNTRISSEKSAGEFNDVTVTIVDENSTRICLAGNCVTISGLGNIVYSMRFYNAYRLACLNFAF
ncbi:MAG: hypothetical protein ACTSYS_13840 [Promethearchaeota archaeon]